MPNIGDEIIELILNGFLGVEIFMETFFVGIFLQKEGKLEG